MKTVCGMLFRIWNDSEKERGKEGKETLFFFLAENDEEKAGEL
jgi:hypothetical protein